MHRMLALVLLVPIASSCATETAPAGVEVTTLPNGATLRRYAVRPDLPPWTLRTLTRIGGDESRLETVFGNVRGLELAPDGNILVLDFQANEVRTFSESGEYRETIVRGGKGPGEIGGANGLAYDADGTLWINDHGNWRISAIRADGSVLTFQMPALSYGYLWQGAPTRDGWVWDETPHAVGGNDFERPEPGIRSAAVNERSCRFSRDSSWPSIPRVTSGPRGAASIG
jgi:hypothetical protein